MTLNQKIDKIYQDICQDFDGYCVSYDSAVVKTAVTEAIHKYLEIAELGD